jgi:AP-3 complex subunit beta
VEEAVSVVREMLIKYATYIPSDLHAQCVVQLLSILPQLGHAQAHVVWLTRYYSLPPSTAHPASSTTAYVTSYAPDILRQLAKHFIHASNMVKLQTLRLGLVLSLTRKEMVIRRLFIYLLELARYDRCYDVRDDARWMRALAARHGISKEGITDAVVEVAEHPVAAQWLHLLDQRATTTKSTSSRSDPRTDFTLGSMALVLGHPITGYEPLPDWPTEQPDPTVRHVPTAGSHPEQDTLEAFYANTSSEDVESFYTSSSGLSDTTTDEESEEDSEEDTSNEEDTFRRRHRNGRY